MGEKDIQKLQELAAGKLKKGITKKDALRSFMDAGILNKKGNFTKPYQSLAKVVKQS
jgi:hypothetical protein